MRLTFSRAQLSFFRRYRFLAIEGLLDPGQAASLDHTLQERLLSKTAHASDCELNFLHGRDLWRTQKGDRPLTSATPDHFLHDQRTLYTRAASLLGLLTEEQQIRYGIDHYLIAPLQPAHLALMMSQSFFSYLDSPHSLSALSSIQGVLGGVLVALTPASAPTETDAAAGSASPAPTCEPHETGSALFFAEDHLLHLAPWLKQCGRRYLLIVYCRAKSVYIRCTQSPHRYFLHDLGYQVGDCLTDALHPILNRRRLF